MDKNFWFYVIFGAVYVGSIVLTYIAAAKKNGKDINLKELVESAVYAAEQIIPGETGAKKFAFVMSQLQTITKIDDSQMEFVRILIEGAVKKFKLESAQAAVITTGVTVAGQHISDDMALRILKA